MKSLVKLNISQICLLFLALIVNSSQLPDKKKGFLPIRIIEKKANKDSLSNKSAKTFSFKERIFEDKEVSPVNSLKIENMSKKAYLDFLKNNTFSSIIVSSTEGNKTLDKTYKGSLYFNFPEKPMKMENVTIYVYNNFYISNSTLRQELYSKTGKCILENGTELSSLTHMNKNSMNIQSKLDKNYKEEVVKKGIDNKDKLDIDKINEERLKKFADLLKQKESEIRKKEKEQEEKMKKEEESRKKEEEAWKKKEEDEIRKKLEEEKKMLEENNRKKLEEERKKQQEEAQKKLDYDRKKQEEETKKNLEKEKKKIEEEKRKQEEERKKQEEERKQIELEKKQTEETKNKLDKTLKKEEEERKKQEEDRKKMQDERKKFVEEEKKKLEEEKKKLEEEAKNKLELEKKKLEEEAEKKRLEEEKRKHVLEQLKQDEIKKKQEEERKRKDEERKRQDEERKRQDEENKKRQEEENKKKEEERKRQEEENKKKEEERKRQVEELFKKSEVNTPKKYEPVQYLNNGNIQSASLNPKKTVIHLPEFLPCMYVDSVDYQHFVMNFEKCKQLNKMYLVLYQGLVFNYNQLNEFYCNHYKCKYKIFIKFRDYYTELLIIMDDNRRIEEEYKVTISPGILKIGNFDIKQFDFETLKDFISCYLYNPLLKLIKKLPPFSDYEIGVFIEGVSFEELDEGSKRNLKRAILSIQNIDDRFKLDWNNIRYIDSNEKNINHLLMLKGEMNKENLMTLNYDSNGISVIGSEPSTSYFSNPDNFDSFNKNNDPSKTFIQVNNKGSTENIYAKSFNYKMDNVEKNFYDLLKNQPSFRSVPYNCHGMNCENEGICYMGRCICKEKFYGRRCEKSLIKRKKMLKAPTDDVSMDSHTINIEEKYQNILNSDPNFMKLQNYISEQIQNENIHNFIKKKNESVKVQNIEHFRFKNSKTQNITSIQEQKKPFAPNTSSHNTNKTHIKSAKHPLVLNPCFNKGYYDNELKINGAGNFDKCHNYILSLFFNNVTNLTTTSSYYNKSNLEYRNKTKLILGHDFNILSFLLQKDKQTIIFKELKNRVRSLCNMEYSILLISYSNITELNKSKLCFDLTYLVCYLEKIGIQENVKFILSKFNENYELLTNPFNLSFIIHENKLICLLLFISCLFDILLFWHSDNIVEFLSSKLIGDRIYLTEEDLMNYLSNPSIKFYLFNEKNDAQLKEKCKEFIDNNINNRRNHFDQVGFIAVFKDVLLQDDKLKNMIYESKKFFLELKITIIVNLIQIIFLIMFVVNFCILLHSVKVKFGLLRILTTFVSILFIVSVMIVCFKIIFKTEKGKYTDKTKSLATNN